MIRSDSDAPAAEREPPIQHPEPTIQNIPLTRRELHGSVWRLAWPSVLTMLLQTFNSLMDAFFVGHLPNGAQALAATGVGGGIQFLLISLSMGASVGATALVARFTGAHNHASAIRATGQSLTLGVVMGAVFGVLAYAGRGALIGWLLDSHKSPEAAALCVQFVSVTLLASIPLFLINVAQGAFRGVGDTRTPLRITGVMIAAHITLNALLIYGRFGFPALGVRGAGIALTASLFVGAILFLYALRRSALAAAFARENLRPDLEWAKRLLRIGIPAAAQGLLRALSMMVFTGMLARAAEGASGVAALQIGLRAEALAFMPGFGYSVAASALVGQSLGAKDPARAERYGWAATWQAIGIMVVMAFVFFAFADPIARAFTGDPTAQRLGRDYLRINAPCEPFLGLGMALTGALQGAGETTLPTVVTLLTMWVVRLPIAQYLMFTRGMNARGAWISMCFSTVIYAVLIALWFRSGRWKRARV